MAAVGKGLFRVSGITRSAIILHTFPRILVTGTHHHCAMAEKPMESSIRNKLSEKFKPDILDIINESYMHNVPKGSETHFKVVIVSDAFEGISLVERHRQVNTILKEEFSKGLHALSIVAKTSSQWEKSNQKIEPSPPCRGGKGL